jgi:ATP-dependent protease Clp ATPase subunit
MYQIDTSNVLFILSGAFVGLDSVIKRRVAKGASLTLFHSKLLTYACPSSPLDLQRS